MEKISRKDAIALGLKRYFTGKECSSGHIAERFCSSFACVVCSRRNFDSWSKSNPDALRLMCNRSYQRNADKKKESARQWRLKNAERVRLTSKQYRDNNKEKIKEYDAKKWSDNSKELYAKNRAWRAANPEIARSYDVVRERRKSIKSPVEDEEFSKFVFKEAASAAVRREKMYGFKWQVDHMVPLSRGGFHSWENIQVIPERLNRMKHSSMIMTKPFEWLDYL